MVADMGFDVLRTAAQPNLSTDDRDRATFRVTVT
jgi:hypothetical protein